MPRIPDHFLDFAYYLYPSRKAAVKGERSGASGFFVGMGSRWLGERFYVYALTARHCLDELGPTPVLRLNTEDGSKDYIETRREEWEPHPDGDDVAAYHVKSLAPPFRNKFIGTLFFLTHTKLAELEIGIGDDVFMIGRFVDHEGRQRNTPAVRFGTVAMMPHEPIIQKESGFPQESFLVEMRSIPGYSGSPVMAFIPPWSLRPSKFSREWSGPWLLGLDYGHLQDELHLVDEKTKKERVMNHVIVQGNSGMACVVPAWKILELLDSGRFKKERKKLEKLEEKKFFANGGVILDSGLPIMVRKKKRKPERAEE